MASGRFNIVLGVLVLMVCAVIGVMLGLSMEPYFVNGYAQIPLWRYLAKAGHTHGMPFGLINIIFGILIARADASEKLKKAGAVLTAFALLLPLGTSLRGLTEGAKFAEVIAMAGGFCFMAACVVMIRLQCRCRSSAA